VGLPDIIADQGNSAHSNNHVESHGRYRSLNISFFITLTLCIQSRFNGATCCAGQSRSHRSGGMIEQFGIEVKKNEVSFSTD
jgi:hypothetical protein